jgi:acyl-CoA dehydrogenase
MTRTFMIFGQGATRCHPYAQKVLAAMEKEDTAAFRNNLLGWIGHFLMTIGRTFVRTLTRGLTAGSPVDGDTATYYRRLGWAASRYAMLTNLAMFFIAGKLKAKGKLTGRYADAIAWQFLAFSTLRRFEAEGRRPEDLPLVRYACDYALREVQLAFEGIYANFKAPLVGLWMRTVGSWLLRLNPLAGPLTDKVSHEAALCIDHFDDQYKRLVDGVFHAPESFPGVGRLMKAFRLVTEAHAAAERIIYAQRKKQLTRGLLPAEVADEAVAKGIVDVAEARLLKEALAARLEAIEVDVFTPEQFYATINGTGGLTLEDVPQKLAVNA